MGIFTRFRDIVSANLNAMLDKAEDPEKLIKLMIHEMEDTLIELKASCAGCMATVKKVERQLSQALSRSDFWKEKAELAISRGRDDLAREALLEKRRYSEKTDNLDLELTEHNALVDRYYDDIRQLEEKLKGAREKQRLLTQRQIRARVKKQAQEEIRRAAGSDTMLKFDMLETRIERMEAEADLVNPAAKSTLEEQIDALAADDAIEAELAAMKSRPKRSECGKKES